MSSAGAPGGAAVPQSYFCHQCNRTVTLTPSPSSDLACPICHGGFLEELESPNPNPNPNPTTDPFHPFPDPFSSSSSPFPNLPFFFSASSSGGPVTTMDTLQEHPEDLFGFPGFESLPLRSPSSDNPEPFNPMQFLAGYLQTLVAGGANIQLVVENSSSPSDLRFPTSASLGDYFIGPGLEQLIHHLSENDPNRYGTPPASKSVVDSLPDVKISEDLLASDEDAQCAVCKDTFEIGMEAKLMPCKHIYHNDCILPWLSLHNSCPVCRYELPTDDVDYEHRMRGALPPPSPPSPDPSADSGGGGIGIGAGVVSGEGIPPGVRIAERRFRISLPWPLRALMEVGPGGNSSTPGSGSADTNSGARGDRDAGSEARQEDLD